MNTPFRENFDGQDYISLDIETCDPHLTETGPSVRTGGYIVGVSLAAPDGWSQYFPMRHEGGGNMDQGQVMNYLSRVLSLPIPKLGANLSYDLDYLTHACVDVVGPYYDIQIAEPLLDENRRSFSLNSLAKDYVGEGKAEEELERYVREIIFDGKRVSMGKVKGSIWKCHAAIVRKYAIADAQLPIKIFQQQRKKLEEQGLWDLFMMETDLLPMLVEMRQDGVAVNLEAAEELHKDLEMREAALRREINSAVMWNVNIHAAADLAKAFDKLGIEYPRTEKGAPSFTKEWLDFHPANFPKLISKAREVYKLRTTFIEGHILKHEVNGRIHCQFNQLKGDEYGTVTGRLSSSTPNMQQIPARTETGNMIRRLFVPEPGQNWAKLDYSQIEPRLLLHFAHGEAARKVRDDYAADPAMDCYMPLLEKLEGKGFNRFLVKTIYLGMCYGMGKNKLAAQLGMTVDEAEPYLKYFHEAAPYVKASYDQEQRKALHMGQIETLLGRKARFDLWMGRDIKKIYMDKDECLAEEGMAKRAFVYKALNRKIQGSAADVMKKAMVDIYKSGVCDVLGLPLLTVHDELDFSVPNNLNGIDAVLEAKNIMETCCNFCDLRVPLRVDDEIGMSWGELSQRVA